MAQDSRKRPRSSIYQSPTKNVLEFVNSVMNNDKNGVEKILGSLALSECKISKRVQTPDALIKEFVHEMTPLMFVLETGNWDLLPILFSNGYDPHQRQRSSRRRMNQMKMISPNPRPLERLWFEGDYDYESLMEYFFAYVFEYLEEWKHSILQFDGNYHQLHHYRMLGKVGTLLTHGLDSNRMNVVRVFDLLGRSLMYNLTHNYQEEERYFPDFPCGVALHLIELQVIESLFKHGFADLEKLERLDEKTDWMDITFQLVTHPRVRNFCLEAEESESLPQILQTAALLLINVLVSESFIPEDTIWRWIITTPVIFKLNFYRHNRRLTRKIMFHLMGEYNCMLRSPLSLLLLARNQIRKCLKGIDFKRKVASLGLPDFMETFVTYIDVEHLPLIYVMPFLASMANGRLSPFHVADISDSDIKNDVPNTPQSCIKDPYINKPIGLIKRPDVDRFE